MTKVKVFTKKANYFNQSALFSFGELSIDEKGIAEVDAKHLEALSSAGFFPVEKVKTLTAKEKKEQDALEAEKAALEAEKNKGLSEEEIAEKAAKEALEALEVEAALAAEADKKPLTADELESLKLSLFKKKNEDLEKIIADAKPDLPKEEYTGKIKKELVELILSF